MGQDMCVFVCERERERERESESTGGSADQIRQTVIIVSL